MIFVVDYATRIRKGILDLSTMNVRQSIRFGLQKDIYIYIYIYGYILNHLLNYILICRGS